MVAAAAEVAAGAAASEVAAGAAASEVAAVAGLLAAEVAAADSLGAEVAAAARVVAAARVAAVARVAAAALVAAVARVAAAAPVAAVARARGERAAIAGAKRRCESYFANRRDPWREDTCDGVSSLHPLLQGSCCRLPQPHFASAPQKDRDAVCAPSSAFSSSTVYGYEAQMARVTSSSSQPRPKTLGRWPS